MEENSSAKPDSDIWQRHSSGGVECNPTLLGCHPISALTALLTQYSYPLHSSSLINEYSVLT